MKIKLVRLSFLYSLKTQQNLLQIEKSNQLLNLKKKTTFVFINFSVCTDNYFLTIKFLETNENKTLNNITTRSNCRNFYQIRNFLIDHKPNQ